jgi:hypothetical protein
MLAAAADGFATGCATRATTSTTTATQHKYSCDCNWYYFEHCNRRREEVEHELWSTWWYF